MESRVGVPSSAQAIHTIGQSGEVAERSPRLPHHSADLTHFLLSSCCLTSAPITLGTFFCQRQLSTLP